MNCRIILKKDFNEIHIDVETVDKMQTINKIAF
jgi:hypothetical protein